MSFYIGTSGFSYKEWKGRFYPADLPASKMLEYYSSHFNAVEINNTFYRMPREEMLSGWRETVPDTFRFVLKAPRRITHQKKLSGCEDDVGHLYDVSEALGTTRGPFLVQIPPYVRGDLDLLRTFLDCLPDGFRFALETRHDTWNDPETVKMLVDSGHTFCVADVDDEEPAELPSNASWGYLRLRRTDYDVTALEIWADRIRQMPWTETWIFLKHEDEGKGPKFAATLQEMLATQ